MKNLFMILVLAVLAAVVGCGKKEGSSDHLGSFAADKVLAKVNGSEILHSQLGLVLKRLSLTDSDPLDQELKNTLLQSLVQQRAIALMAQAKMSNAEKLEIAAQVSTYRDELLVQKFLQDNSPPEPVTADMVLKYYQDNISEYQEEPRLIFEYWVTTEKELTEEERNAVLQAYSTLSFDDDWKAKIAGYSYLPIQYKTASLKKSWVSEPLASHLQLLAPGQMSGVIIDDFLFVAKLIDRQVGLVKPLSEVSSDIRNKLIAAQLKEVLTSAFEAALSQVKITYPEPDDH